ncbi:PKD domain-containing protein [Yoonia sp. R2-816]|uniref:PKD domain-containing protein n=1 Tax=Yoonia sp. R2-816 TaxID=3342638 RepID=UPI00372C4D36
MPDPHPILGPIISGVVVGAVLGVGGFFLGKATAPDVPPMAAISPEMASITAGENIQFSAAGSSSTASTGINEFRWKIGGHPATESSVGYCDSEANAQIADCRFNLPGTYSVSVDVTDETGLTATAVAPITVTLENGFVGVVLFAGRDPAATDQAYRVILAAIDWQDIQRTVSRPIVIFDPDKKAPVYAASIPFVEGAIDYLDNDLFAGAKVMIPPFDPSVREVVVNALRDLGSSVQIVPLGEMELNIQNGLAGSGFLTFDSPEDYILSIRN